MGKSRFIELMAKSMGKSATKEELKELDIFLNQFSSYKKMHEVTHALKGEIKTTSDSVEQRDVNTGLGELWDRIKTSEETDVVRLTHTETEKQRKGLFTYMKWTAAAILLASITGFFFYFSSPPADTFLANTTIQKIYVPYGQTKDIVLPDGTKVKLNAGSTFMYPKVFAKTNREVRLTGEGFFEVKKQSDWPFLVRTNNILVKVLGTVFNVKAYNDDHNTETTLFKGKVEVSLKNKPEKKIILLPNEKLIVANDLLETGNTENRKIKEAKIEYQLKRIPDIGIEDMQEAAWLANRLVFTNETFEGVAKQLERRYDVKVMFDDPMLKTEQLSGALEQESLIKALKIIQMTTPFDFRIDKRIVHISRNK